MEMKLDIAQLGSCGEHELKLGGLRADPASPNQSLDRPLDWPGVLCLVTIKSVYAGTQTRIEQMPERARGNSRRR